MRDFKGVSKNLYNKYRFEFVGLVEQCPELFDKMMHEILTSYNLYCTKEYQNYFSSRVFQEKKETLYEILFRTYAKLRMQDKAEYESLKNGDTTIKEFIQINSALLGYNLSGLKYAAFRDYRERGVVYSVLAYHSDQLDKKRHDSERYAVEFLDEYAASISEESRTKFNKLSSAQKVEWYELKKEEALNALNERNQIGVNIPQEK